MLHRLEDQSQKNKNSIIKRNMKGMVVGDLNGHVEKQMSRLLKVHGENCVEKRIADGRMLLDYCDERQKRLLGF